MKVVILCGGRGTRIRDISQDVMPKPMVPIGGHPIVWHIMKSYAHFGHKEFILCLGYQGDVIKKYFSNPDNREDWQVTLADTGLHAMTGARVKRIQQHIGGDENFMLTYGDGVGDVNLDQLLKFHLNHGKILTITGVRPPSRFGEVVYDPNGLITEFNEKPQATKGRISGGFFVCRREIFDVICDDDSEVLEITPIKRLVANQQVMLYKHDGFWQPMDTHREYECLTKLYETGKAPWVVWTCPVT